MISEIKKLNKTLYSFEGNELKKLFPELLEKIKKEKKLPFHKVYVSIPKNFFIPLMTVLIKHELDCTGMQEEKQSIILEI